MTAPMEKVAESIASKSKNSDYIDPTQSLPTPPPKQCQNHLIYEPTIKCNSCNSWSDWWNKLKHTVNDLLFKSNVHSCDCNINKDGSRKKGISKGCKDNIWEKCKAQFP